MGQQAPHHSMGKLPPPREKVETIEILESQKIGRETLYLNKRLIELLKE